MKDELSGKIMKKIVGLIANTCSYLRDSKDEDKKSKGSKKKTIKRKLKFRDYKNCLEATQRGNKIKHLKNEIDVESPKKD